MFTRFFIKRKIRKLYSFLNDYKFYETTNTEVVLKDWLKNGVAFTDDSKVIILVFDYFEFRFVTIFYIIQENKEIPIFDKKKYYTLKERLEDRLNFKDFETLTDYRGIGKNKAMKNSAELLKKYWSIIYD